MITRKLLPATLALALSACMLAACGGGGGGAMVRPEAIDPPPPSPPPPPPPPPTTEPCPAPITGACVVDGAVLTGTTEMTGGRSSDYALTVRGNGYLTLTSHHETYGPPIADYRFGGGTTIEAGTLRVVSSASLHSDVVVQPGGDLALYGTATGELDNRGHILLWNTVTGNVSNSGVLTPGAYNFDDLVIPAHVEGDLSQPAAGTLDAIIGAATGGYVSVSGRADIDGTLRLVAYADDWGSYPLPATPVSVQVLHADGGVFGQFAQWTSPGLFVTGNLRYLANDVFFDASAISAAQAMAAVRAGDVVTLGAAHNFDAALGKAGGFRQLPATGLTAVQRQFLASAAAIQRLQDYGQAVRTFDSLSGHGYASAADTLLQQATLPAQGLVAHLGNLHPGLQAGAWSAQPMTLATGAGTFSEQRSGFDQWLGDRILMGASLGWSDGNLHFDRSGGNARDRSPQWDFYLRRNSKGDAYVLGSLGYSHHELNLGRQIDLGFAKRNAYAMRSLDVEHVYVETGRDLGMRYGRVTPFVALSYAAVRAAAFTENGSSGFELAAQPSHHQRTNAAAGLRLSRSWGSGRGQWTQLNLSSGVLHLLNARDEAYAAFTGAPDVTFALAGMPRQRNTGWLQLNLGTGGENWAWRLSYDRQADAEAASVGMQLRF